MEIVQSKSSPDGQNNIANSHVGYRMVIEPSDQRIQAVFNGETIVDSRSAMIMQETRLSPVFYFPREDIRMDFLSRTNRRSNCPFKGNASYWDVVVGSNSSENAAWSYEDAYDEASIVKDYVAFYWNEMDYWLVDGEEMNEQSASDQVAKTNPLVNWLVRDAWKANSTVEQGGALAIALMSAGFPLWSMRLMVRTLNPQLFARFYSWKHDGNEVTENEAPHAGAQSEQYLNSPFALIIKGEGGVRRRLDGLDPTLDFPVLEDLIKEGATDYVAVPLNFSDGQINVLTLVSDAPGGFSTEQLGNLYEILPNLGRLLEAHAQRISSLTLLKTYLGRNAGERVNGGLVKRGDGEELHAVIWFSDLRQSTSMANTMPREEYLAALNSYFDCVVGAIIDHEGEVLKFIGDAVLAIFPIEKPSDSHPDACARALSAIRTADKQLSEVNLEREAEGQPLLNFGTALHRGTITYGNVGTERRLDFTVIGPAVNEAARIEDLCKTLGEPVLMSSAFASGAPDGLISLGNHSLRGVKGSQEIFGLTSSNQKLEENI
jgi:adenylate cyclase